MFKTVTVRWDQLVAIGDRGASPTLLLLVWNDGVSSRNGFVAFRDAQLEEGGLERISQRVNEKRPNLPIFRNGKVQED